MREILFRGKRVDNNEWVYGDYAIQSNHACFKSELKYTSFILKDEFMDWGLGGLAEYEVVPKTVGQFTGLTDKNGKKIFEGDIIEYTWDTLCGGKEHRTYVISYSNNKAKFVADCVIGNPRHSLPTFEYIGERGEVIGNIYNNKEILEEKE